jgi:hypothetical protein
MLQQANTLFTLADPDARRKNALAKCYALLIRLAEESQSQADPQPAKPKQKESQNEK